MTTGDPIADAALGVVTIHLRVTGARLPLRLYLCVNGDLAEAWTEREASFDFSLDVEFVRTRLPEVVGVPFRAYYAANPFDAMNDAAIKALLAVPVGALLWLCWPPHTTPRVPEWLRNAVLLSGAAVFFALVEAGQLLLPSRFPDATDVVIGLAGTAVGLVLMACFAHAPASRV